MDDITKSIVDSIDNRVNKLLKNLKFDYTLTGKVKTINTSTYTVTIDDFDTNLKARAGLSLQIGDLVYVRVVQGNFSEKFIDCKIP